MTVLSRTRSDSQPGSAAPATPDLIVATNIFVYYEPFEQRLALGNAAAMLKPGGLLLTNDRLPEIPDGPVRLAGITVIPFDSSDAQGRQAIGWYQKRP